ncbi:MAG: DUF1540 domain-containing protein [Firmicutes bacterium]|jgi:hypothetical protein|nr:DUF1540 domain-containing protein [Bacillota bacterium]
MPSIYCSVNNCHYWKKGNMCDANQIMITSDEIGSTFPDSIDAPDHDQLEQTPVDSCMETCCKTFVEKGSGKEKDDGVMRM